MRAKRAPKYCHHKPTSRGYCRTTDADGVRSTTYFPGRFNSPESRAAYHAFLRRDDAPADEAGSITCEQLSAVWLLERREQTDLDTDNGYNRFSHDRQAAALLASLAGLPASDMTCGKLKKLRRMLIDEGRLALRTLNRRIDHVRNIFRWATTEDMIRDNVWHSLMALPRLQTHDAPSVKPPREVSAVDTDDVLMMLPHLSPTVRAMVKVQALTGCRAGELVQLRWQDIVKDGHAYGEAVWYFEPPQHKNKWRKKTRRIFIGPSAQQVLAEYERTRPIKDAEYIFTPVESAAWKLWERSRNYRAAPGPEYEAKQPARINSWQDGLARVDDTRTWQFKSRSYLQAIRRACGRAGIVPIKTHQLRHAVSEKLDRIDGGGREKAAAVLGHDISTADIYAGRNHVLAAKMMAEHG